jgi:hypothetical protein
MPQKMKKSQMKRIVSAERKAVRRVDKALKPKSAKPTQKYAGLLSDIGGTVGSLFGDAGRSIGSSAGDFLSKITGWGSYKVQNNTLSEGNAVPSFTQTGDGVIICHREFIQDIVGSTAFNNVAIPVNPGMATTFPWLASVAESFEEYEFLGLVFEYRPSSGSAVATNSSALGIVVYATDYNVNAPPFGTKQMMESYEYSTSTVPFNAMIHPVECSPNNRNVLNTHLVRTSSLPTGADQQFYDIGNFEFATQGMQSAYNVGELWVSYHVALKKPRIGVSALEYAHIVDSSQNATAAAPMGTGTSGKLTTGSSLPGVLASSATGFLIENPGTYFISANWQTTSSDIAANAQLSLGGNITGSPPGFSFANQAVYAFTSTVAIANCFVTVNTYGTGAANTVSWVGLTSMTNADVDIYVFPVPYNII